jgi:hypothetical protein
MRQNITNYYLDKLGNCNYFISSFKGTTKGCHWHNYRIVGRIVVPSRTDYSCNCYDSRNGVCKHIDSLKDGLITGTVGTVSVDYDKWLRKRDRLTGCLPLNSWVNPMGDEIQFMVGGVDYTYQIKNDILIQHDRGNKWEILSQHDQVLLGGKWLEKFKDLV